MKIREGMGHFWDSVTKEKINSLYESPSSNRVLAMFHIVPLTSQEAKVARWLSRYLREVDSGMLGRLLHFYTALHIVIPGSKLKVRFINIKDAESETPSVLMNKCTQLENMEVKFPIQEMQSVQSIASLSAANDRQLITLKAKVVQLSGERIATRTRTNEEKRRISC